jgi:hypothetical protein
MVEVIIFADFVHLWGRVKTLFCNPFAKRDVRFRDAMSAFDGVAVLALPHCLRQLLP